MTFLTVSKMCTAVFIIFVFFPSGTQKVFSKFQNNFKNDDVCFLLRKVTSSPNGCDFLNWEVNV